MHQKPRLAARLTGPFLTSFALAALPASALADDAPNWTLSGYGSLGVVHADQRMGDFTNSVLKSNGAGYSRSWSADVDSRLGAQVDATLNRQWSAVLQVVAEQGIDGSHRPRVEWFNVKFQPLPELSVRLGRVALPMFLAADYRKAGYAYPWARTPVEVYGAIPISFSDGIDATFRWRTGDVKHVTQGFYGRADNKIDDTARAKARGLAGISHTVEMGAASARLSVMTSRLTVDLAAPLFGGFRQFGPQGMALADKYDVIDRRAVGMSLGVSYDPGEWFIQGEAGRLDARSFLGDKGTLYASGGYRYNNLTPYLAYARVWSMDPTTDPGLSLAGLPPPLAGAAGALNAGLNELLKTVAVQSTITAGVRWDFSRNVALKLQLDRVKPKDGSYGMLINVQPGFQSGKSISVTSVVLDFVF